MSASVPQCYRDPQLTTALRAVLGGRSPVGITSAGGNVQNEAYEDDRYTTVETCVGLREALGV